MIAITLLWETGVVQDNRNLVSANEPAINLRMRVFPRRIAAVAAGLMFSAPVYAYIGPGAGLSAIGSVLALVGAVLLMILGFVWYPVKRILVRKREDSEPSSVDMESSEVDDSPQTGDVSINQPRQS